MIPINHARERITKTIGEANIEDVIFIFLSTALTIISIYTYTNGLLIISPDTVLSSISLVIQTISSIFAIIIAISLVAIQLTAQNYSSKLIKIYTKNFHFKCFMTLFIVAMILNIYVLFYIEIVSDILINISVLVSAMFIIELIPFIISITKNLDPTTIIEYLIKDLRNYKETKNDDVEIYDSLFQPIEDLITRSISNFDYQTAKYGIKLFLEDFTSLIKTKVHSVNYLDPYFVLMWNVLNNAKKTDAIEIIKYTFSLIFHVINELPDNNYLPVYDRLIDIIENVRYQAENRFDDKEYILELAEMKLMVADSLSEFSQKTV